MDPNANLLNRLRSIIFREKKKMMGRRMQEAAEKEELDKENRGHQNESRLSLGASRMSLLKGTPARRMESDEQQTKIVTEWQHFCSINFGENASAASTTAPSPPIARRRDRTPGLTGGARIAGRPR